MVTVINWKTLARLEGFSNSRQMVSWPVISYGLAQSEHINNAYVIENFSFGGKFWVEGHLCLLQFQQGVPKARSELHLTFK